MLPFMMESVKKQQHMAQLIFFKLLIFQKSDYREVSSIPVSIPCAFFDLPFELNSILKLLSFFEYLTMQGVLKSI